MYEVMALRWKMDGAGREAMLLAVAFLAAFAYFGWKYAAGEEAVFPVFSRVCARLDELLEQVGEEAGALQTIAELFQGTFYASSGSS